MQQCLSTKWTKVTDYWTGSRFQYQGQKPTPEEEEQSLAYPADLPFKDFDPVLTAIAGAHKDINSGHTV